MTVVAVNGIQRKDGNTVLLLLRVPWSSRRRAPRPSEASTRDQDAGALEEIERIGRTDELIRLEAEQRLAPSLERRRGPPLFAGLSVDRQADPKDRWAVGQDLRELLDLLADVLDGQ